jgi:hypothetical protein
MRGRIGIFVLFLCAATFAAGLVFAQNPAVTPTPRAEMVWENRSETWMGRFYDNVRQVAERSAPSAVGALAVGRLPGPAVAGWANRPPEEDGDGRGRDDGDEEA